jgi:hypothetical protein
MRTKVSLTLGAVLLLGGCATQPNGYPYLGGADNWGEANRQTLAAQVVDPVPVYDTPFEGSAQKAVAASDRYYADKVKQPDRVKTSNAEAGSTGGR